MDLDCSYSVTQDLCVTPFHAHVRARGLRFYPAFSWAVLYAVNRHREFRMGLDGEGRPGYYDEIHAEYTVLDRRTGNMDSLNTAYRAAFSEFYAAMAADLERFEHDGTRTVSRENSVLLSCVPWFTYTGLSFHMKSNLSFLAADVRVGKVPEAGGGAADALHHSGPPRGRGWIPLPPALRGPRTGPARAGKLSEIGFRERAGAPRTRGPGPRRIRKPAGQWETSRRRRLPCFFWPSGALSGDRFLLTKILHIVNGNPLIRIKCQLNVNARKE